jgi:hypothetical protein
MAVDVLGPAADLLSEALADIDGVRHYRLRGGAVSPPATILAPPTVTWNGMAVEPSDASWVVALVVADAERSDEQLWSLLPAVYSALDGLNGRVVVRDARPDSYPSGGVNLPAYVFNLDVSLPL